MATSYDQKFSQDSKLNKLVKVLKKNGATNSIKKII